MSNPHILKVIQMYRTVRGWSYEEACREGLRVFDARGWEIPDSIRGVLVLKATPKAERDQCQS